MKSLLDLDRWPAPVIPDGTPEDLKEQMWREYVTTIEPVQILTSLLAADRSDLQEFHLTRLSRYEDRAMALLCLYLVMELLPGRFEKQTREFATERLTELWNETFDVQRRLEERRMANQNTGHQGDAQGTVNSVSAKDIALEMVAELSRLRPKAKNFSGLLCAEVVDAEGRVLPAMPGYHQYRAKDGSGLQLRVWLHNLGDPTGATEELIYLAGDEPRTGETLHFELSADCPSSQVRPLSLTIPMAVGSDRSKAAVFTLYDKLPVGKHRVWVTAFQAGILMQSVELEVVVGPAAKVALKRTAKENARKP